MLSLKFIRDNIELVNDSLIMKNIDFDINVILKLDDNRKLIIQQVEKLKSERNIVTKVIAQTKKSGKIQQKQFNKCVWFLMKSSH